MRKLNFSRRSAVRVGFVVAWFATVALLSSAALAQTSVATGSILGTVTNDSDAFVRGAKVTITGPTGQTIIATTDDHGTYSFGLLIPGVYTVRIEAKGFKTARLTLKVSVDNAANGSVKLQPGPENAVVDVPVSEVAVNMEQVTVQGVLNTSQIENLPINGRNFMDLAQLEPGVLTQDGANIDATKVGYFAISIGGRFGRATRVELDGVDLNDETVGATMENIPASAIQEFAVAQSSLDLSNVLAASGAVNVVTRSGTGSYHGEAFGFFRDHGIATASLTHPVSLPSPYFQRNQEGASLGGPVIKDKMFVFADGEHTSQHLQAPVLVSPPFEAYSSSFAAPFTENNLLARLDYELNPAVRLFGRVTYFNNSADATFFPGSFQVYDNRDVARNAAFGANFNRGSYTHSVGFSYFKFQNHILDATGATSLPFANYPVSININGFTAGPNPLAPQNTSQSNIQFSYDGSRLMGHHIFRFGASWNRIQAAHFGPLYGSTPSVFGNGTIYPGCAGANTANCPLGPDGTTKSNPLDYEMVQAVIGNGQGFSTERSALGFAAGGLGPDNRIAVYIGDSWKVHPGLTLTPGLSYVRDTWRTDSDLGPIAAINAAFPGMGNAVRQPGSNFAPQFGLAWDPTKNGTTVFRAGAGIFYENILYNNVLLDRSLRLQKGTFLYTPSACLNGQAQPIVTPTGTLFNSNSNCVNNAGVPLPIFQAAQNIATLQNSLQAAYPFSLTSPNGAYAGRLISAGINLPLGLLAPNYRTPRALQMNIGIQHELRPGMVLSLDFLRSIETHGLLGVDANDVGDPHFFNLSSAQQAIQNTITACGATSLQGAISSCPGLNNGQPNIGATISNFTAFGLGSAEDTGSSCFTAPNPLTHGATTLGYPCAFTGRNINYGTAEFLQPISRSVYNGLQMKVVQNMTNPVRWIKRGNLQLVYSFSRFESPVAFAGNTPRPNPFGANDPDSVLQAADNNDPLRFMGQSLLDRTHQVSFGSNFEMPFGFHLGIVGHFYSPLSSPAIVGSNGSGGQIFQTDFTGGGVYSQPLAGTKNGAFGRNVSFRSMNQAITKYNREFAGQVTPAGQELVSNNLFSSTQLAQIGAVAPVVSPVPADQLLFPWTKDLDVKLAWSHRFRERFTVEPSVSFYNVFNFSNFDQPPAVTSPWLTAGSGAVNSTHSTLQPGERGIESDVFRTGVGTGVFGMASPRVAEFALKVTF